MPSYTIMYACYASYQPSDFCCQAWIKLLQQQKVMRGLAQREVSSNQIVFVKIERALKNWRIRYWFCCDNNASIESRIQAWYCEHNVDSNVWRQKRDRMRVLAAQRYLGIDRPWTNCINSLSRMKWFAKALLSVFESRRSILTSPPSTTCCSS